MVTSRLVALGPVDSWAQKSATGAQLDPDSWPVRVLADCTIRPHTLLVLYDTPDTCLHGLASFIDAARSRGFDLVCDVPADCAPIADDRIVAELDHVVAVD